MNQFVSKFFIVIVVMLLAGTGLRAQSSIGAAGTTASNANGSFTYNVGEVAIQQARSNNNMLSEGVLQPYEVQRVSISDVNMTAIDATVFPNPTVHKVVVQVEGVNGDTQCTLYDVNGRTVFASSTAKTKWDIDFAKYPSGIYMLSVTNGNKLGQFKIIKR